MSCHKTHLVDISLLDYHCTVHAFVGPTLDKCRPSRIIFNILPDFQCIIVCFGKSCTVLTRSNLVPGQGLGIGNSKVGWVEKQILFFG